MKHTLPTLDRLKVFEAAGRHLSFSAAADELCLTKGAVSYQIRALEAEIATSLFKRGVRQVLLTDAGQLLLQATQRLIADFAETLNRVRAEDAGRDVIVAATTYVAARWLSPRVAAFLQHYPGISIMFQHAVNAADFSLADVDIAIRWGRCDGRRSREKLLELPMPLFPVISPKLLRRLANPSAGNIPGEITLLCEERREDLWIEWAGEETLAHPRRVITDANVRVQAAIDGQGAILADELMHSEIANGLLVAPFGRELSGYGYVIMSDPRRSLSVGGAALRDWLMAPDIRASRAPGP